MEVRRRRFVVVDVAAGTAPASVLEAPLAVPQHLVSLASVEDDAHGEAPTVIWEIEPGARIHERGALPSPTSFDAPQRLDAFLNAVRWGGTVPPMCANSSAPFAAVSRLTIISLIRSRGRSPCRVSVC